MDKQERTQKIIELVREGYGVRDIAPLFGITFQRVSQICYDNGVSINELRTERFEKARQERRLAQKTERSVLKKIQFFEKYSDLDPDIKSKWSRESELLNDTDDPKVLRNRKASREYYRRNYYKAVARRISTMAIKHGYIVPTPCLVCGSPNVEQHHYNGYTRPLDIHFYCKEHHMELHRGDKREVATKRASHKRSPATLETRKKLKEAWVRRRQVNKLNEIN